MYRILVVEDEESFVKVITEQLSQHGFEVVTASSTKAALALLENDHNLDAIWTDHYMPGKSGLELVSEVKDRDDLKVIPIFVISNTADGEDMYSYIQLGVTEYFVKSESRLVDIIRDVKKYLDEHKKS